MPGLEILVVLAVIGFVIYQQVTGQLLRAKRVLALPAVVTIIGLFDLHGAGHLRPADIVWLTAGAAGSLLAGLAFGAITRLESRGGVLWAKLPPRGLWLWVALLGWRVLVMVLAGKAGAHVAASTAPLLFTLGLNRLGQGVVIAARGMLAGIPFAPEKDGRTFLSGVFSGDNHGRSERY